MANFDVEKMLSEGLNKDEIWKRFDAEIKNAQDRLDQKANAEEDKKKKEAITENKRITAITALKEYFRDVGYDYTCVALDKNGIKVKLSGKEKVEYPAEETGEALKEITDRMKKYREYEKSNDYPSVAEALKAFVKMRENFGNLDFLDWLS